MKRTAKTTNNTPQWDGAPLDAVKRLRELFCEDAKRFDGQNLSVDDLGDAAGYWLWYRSFVEQLGDDPCHRDSDRAAAYDALVRVHVKAAEALVRAAEENGIPSTPLWESADLCRRLFAEPDGKYFARNPSALKRIGDATIEEPWPDCLEGCVAEISTERIDTARRGLATLNCLSIKLDIKAVKPAEWSLPATHKKWEKRFGKKERTLREWRENGTIRMEKVPGRGLWRVATADPLCIEWDRNRTSFD